MLLLVFVLILAACGTDTMPGGSIDAGVSGAGGSGGGDDSDTPDDAPPGSVDPCVEAASHSDLAWIQQHVFTPSCATMMCHSGSTPSVGLSLEAGTAFANLHHSASTASGWERVVPGSKATSYLLVALGRTPGPMPEDGFMPLGSPALCSGKLEAIERWVEAGAQP